MQKINVLFLGLHYQKKDESMLIKICKNGVSAAHYTFEENIINGMKKYIDVDVAISLPVGSFPFMSNQLFLRSSRNDSYQKIGYINIPILKDFIRMVKTRRLIKKWLKEKPEDSKKCILIYDAYVPFIKAAIRMNKKKNYKVVCILPDLPGEYGVEEGQYNSVINKYLKIKAKKFYKSINEVDGCIVLTKHMMDAMNIAYKPHIVVESIVNMASVGEVLVEYSTNKVVMYAGELSKNVNLDVLLDAISLIEDMDVEFWICGMGPMSDDIQRAAKTDKRIKFLGYVPKTELQELQKEVRVFVNPRQNSHKYTKYSFPSKNAEYLITGKPLVAYKLDGIPDEYDKYIFYPNSNSAQSLADKISEVLALNEEYLVDNKEKQVKFMQENKSEGIQGKRIVEFLQGV